MHNACQDMLQLFGTTDVADTSKVLASSENKVQPQHLVRKLCRAVGEIHAHLLLAGTLYTCNGSRTSFLVTHSQSPSAKNIHNRHLILSFQRPFTGELTNFHLHQVQTLPRAQPKPEGLHAATGNSQEEFNYQVARKPSMNIFLFMNAYCYHMQRCLSGKIQDLRIKKLNHLQDKGKIVCFLPPALPSKHFDRANF